jgi:hypothetical protein
LVDKQFIFSANYSAVNTTASIRRRASPADLVCRHRVDATLVGHEKAERKVCLAFSLLEHDDIAEVRPDLSPWLASLLVVPKYRAVITVVSWSSIALSRREYSDFSFFTSIPIRIPSAMRGWAGARSNNALSEVRP